ncbi:MAG TPA: BadF/BadG/BcrA/BcrD ATPase family protein [Solirubrobacteraceae bacterium]|nr:BadF/BadG/BcrA/BcrD ATPase family protein [Solirubrobacteraceae bacterium]
MTLVLAVDGGGVKTDLALVDASGAALAVVRGARSQAHYLGVEGVVDVLEGLLEEAGARAGLGRLERPFAATAQILMAGADLPEEVAAIRGGIERCHWSDRLVIDSDMPALLRSGTERGWGIAVVCGNGINCLGRSEDGRDARFLSFGPVSGDWGGGRDIGLAALAAAVRAADGRGPATVLERHVPTHFGLSDPLEVARAAHLEEMPEARLGELAPVVLAVCEKDAVAAGIVQRLADEVVAFVRAAVRRLELADADPDVVLGGGVLRAVSPAVVQTIARGVEEVVPGARVVVARSEPIVGAALLGLDAIGAEPAAKVRARAELDTAVAELSTAVVDRL